MTFFTLYIVLIPLISLVCAIKRKWNYIPFLFILLIAIIRYDTVTDYLHYVEMFSSFLNGDIEWFVIEPLFHCLNLFFSFSSYGYIPVILLCTIMPYIALYKVLSRYNIVWWGTVFFVFLGFIQRFDNIVRQDVAIALFTFSIFFLIKNDFKRYAILNIIAIGFHYTAVVAFVYYFLMKLSMNTAISFKRNVILFAISFILYITNFFHSFIISCISFIPVYGDYVDVLEYFETGTNTGLGVLCQSLAFLLPSIGKENERSKELRLFINMAAYATCIRLVCMSFSVLMRLSDYLFIFQIVALSMFFSYKYQKMLSNLCRIPVLFIFFYIYTVSTIDNYGTKNIYYTIFSQRMRERVFYVRSGFVQDQDLFRDRRDIITFVP